MLKNKTLTYISLFSCAGVGCFGFKKAGFECIATNELIERRINVQKFNDKCKFDSGYICDDITTEETKNKIFAEIKKWEKIPFTVRLKKIKYLEINLVKKVKDCILKIIKHC